MRIPEGTRRALLSAFTDAIWCDASDHELAAEHRTSPAVVRALRAEHRRSLGLARIVQRVDDLARRIHWPGTSAELLAWCVDLAWRTAERNGWRHSDPRMQALRDALRTDREARALERMDPDAA